jgi:hypothetical protein
MRMSPVFELIGRHPEVAAFDLAQPHVGCPDNKITNGIAHGRRAITASSALVEHQWPVLSLERVDNGGSRRSDIYTRNGLSSHKKE